MIIECKCQKYKFRIPDPEIVFPGRHVQCEICDAEWYQKFEQEQRDVNTNSRNLNNLDNIDLSMAKINFLKKRRKKNSSFLLITIIFCLVILITNKLLFDYQDEILSYNSSLENFYESLEIINEIIKSYFIFFKDIFNAKINNL